MTTTVSAPAPATSRAATIVAWAYGAIVAAGVGHFLFGIPIQLTDSYGNILKLDTPWGELMASQFTQRAFLRPFLMGELKLVYDASGGDLYTWFRGTHVVQVFALVGLFLALVRPRSWWDAALIPLGLAVLIGMHTFKGTVVEAFPVNTFLTVVLCCLAAANLSLMRPRWWVDVLAVALFVVAALTVESGLLVWVIFIGAALVGARGVSKPALALLVALLAGYFVLRFAILNVGSPDLLERSSGYGFRMLEPDELIARFGENPLWFYAYNVATSAASVLFSEPRGGVFRLTYGLALGEPESSAILNVIASTCATLVIAAYAWTRRREWQARRFDRDDRLVLLFAMVLAANAVISYPYTKDVIMSPAGAFFAVALFAAARTLLPRWSARLSTGAVAAVLGLVLASTWATRAATIHLELRDAARKVRTEWAYAEFWLERENVQLTTERQRAVFRQLRSDAVYRLPMPRGFSLAERRIFID